MAMTLTEEQILQMKSEATIVIQTGCDDKAASDKSLPTTAYLIDCKDGDNTWKDIVMGNRTDIFDSYYDAFKKNVITKMSWTSGTIHPTTWGNIKNSPPPKKRRKRKEKDG